MNNSTWAPVVVLMFASILWGLSWLPLKFLNQSGIEGIPLLWVSHGLLALSISPFGWRRAYFVPYAKPLLGIAISGGSAILCFTYALMYGDVIRVMVLFYLLPVWGVVGGKLFLGERPDSVRWFGVVLALSGAFLILGGFKIFSSPPSWIDALALLSGLAFAVNNMLFRAVQAVPLTTKLMSMFYGCAVISLLLLVFDVQSFPVYTETKPWVWLVLYTFGWLLFANIGSQWAVTRMEAGKSSIIIIVELVAAVISALIIANESLSLIEWLGCIMVLVAALLEALRDSREAQNSPA